MCKEEQVPKRFYRFRSSNTLLGKHKELENQEIYFASPKELNDPMEGFTDFVFNGDDIIWKNFFNHYLLCLEHICSIYILSGEEHHKITQADIPIYSGFDEFPTPEYKKLFEKISKDFFDICGNFIEKIATRTTSIRKDELSLYLGVVHLVAIELIEKNYIELNLLEKRKTDFHFDSKIFIELLGMIDIVEKMIKEKEEDKIDIIFQIQKQLQDEFSLIRNINDKLIVKSPNRSFLIIEFVDNYINAIEKLMYPEWYTACFMIESHNSSIWGHYGDNHKGICLIFESNENNKIAFDKNTNGIEFRQVAYKNKFTEINFFKFLGALSESKLINTWYTNEKK